MKTQAGFLLGTGDRCIADAEEACRKAQGFALQAASAFGDVASKLNRAWQALD